MDATTPKIVGSTMIRVVAPVLAVVWKRMQYLPTMLRPTVQREKDTTHKTFETMFIARAWPQQCRKSCANGSNVVALRFGDQGIKEMLGVVGLKVWPVSKLCATTRRKQHATGCSNGRDNVGNYWPTILRPFARGFTGQFFGPDIESAVH